MALTKPMVDTGRSVDSYYTRGKSKYQSGGRDAQRGKARPRIASLFGVVVAAMIGGCSDPGSSCEANLAKYGDEVLDLGAWVSDEYGPVNLSCDDSAGNGQVWGSFGKFDDSKLDAFIAEAVERGWVLYDDRREGPLDVNLETWVNGQRFELSIFNYKTPEWDGEIAPRNK